MIRFAFTLVCALTLAAQPTRYIRATGEASVSAKPDQAKVSVAVVTAASTAQEASSQNAALVETVLAQLRALLGPAADIKTTSYSLSPNYRYPQGQQPELTGYTARNSLEVTTGDLSIVGRVIDTAIGAGANSVQGLRFTLQQDEPLRAQALSQAAKEAKAHAEAIASGLGTRIGAVISAQEGGAVRVVPVDVRTAPGAGAQTPIETGLVQVYATVTVDVEIVQ
ncbi:MAG: SIMPL domain-containing protein [Acidobacteriota bacterium]